MIYLQMPKTGTSHIVRLLQHNFPTAGVEHSHEPVKDAPEGLVFGSIRKPYDWYLSYWSQGLRGLKINVFEGLYQDTPQHFRAWMVRMFDPDCARFLHPEFKRGGFYSFYARHLYSKTGEWFVEKMVRTESLEDDLQEVVGPIETFKPGLVFNQSQRQHKDYYDDATRSLVINHDSAVAEHFGYSPCQ